MNAQELLDVVLAHPVLASGIAAALALIKPVLMAVQRALVRRIDSAWPDGSDESHEAKVRETVATVRGESLLPRSVIESAVRRHKTD